MDHYNNSILTRLGIRTHLRPSTDRGVSWETVGTTYATWDDVQAAYPAVDSWATFGKGGDEVWFPAGNIAAVRKELKSAGAKVKCHIGAPCERTVLSQYASGGYRPCGRPLTPGENLCAVHLAAERRKEANQADLVNKDDRERRITRERYEQVGRLAEFGVAASLVRNPYGEILVTIDPDTLYGKLSEVAGLLNASGIENHPLQPDEEK